MLQEFAFVLLRLMLPVCPDVPNSALFAPCWVPKCMHGFTSLPSVGRYYGLVCATPGAGTIFWASFGILAQLGRGGGGRLRSHRLLAKERFSLQPTPLKDLRTFFSVPTDSFHNPSENDHPHHRRSQRHRRCHAGSNADWWPSDNKAAFLLCSRVVCLAPTLLGHGPIIHLSPPLLFGFMSQCRMPDLWGIEWCMCVGGVPHTIACRGTPPPWHSRVPFPFVPRSGYGRSVGGSNTC